MECEPDHYHEVRLGANARINALTAWRVFQIALSRPRLHATSTAKSISGAMSTALCDILRLEHVRESSWRARKALPRDFQALLRHRSQPRSRWVRIDLGPLRKLA